MYGITHAIMDATMAYDAGRFKYEVSDRAKVMRSILVRADYMNARKTMYEAAGLDPTTLECKYRLLNSALHTNVHESLNPSECAGGSKAARMFESIVMVMPTDRATDRYASGPTNTLMLMDTTPASSWSEITNVPNYASEFEEFTRVMRAVLDAIVLMVETVSKHPNKTTFKPTIVFVDVAWPWVLDEVMSLLACTARLTGMLVNVVLQRAGVFASYAPTNMATTADKHLVPIKYASDAKNEDMASGVIVHLTSFENMESVMAYALGTVGTKIEDTVLISGTSSAEFQAWLENKCKTMGVLMYSFLYDLKALCSAPFKYSDEVMYLPTFKAKSERTIEIRNASKNLAKASIGGMRKDVIEATVASMVKAKRKIMSPCSIGYKQCSDCAHVFMIMHAIMVSGMNVSDSSIGAWESADIAVMDEPVILDLNTLRSLA